MKKEAIKIGLMFALVLILAPGVHAYQVTLTQDIYSFGSGGEFNAADPSLVSFLANYDSKALLKNGFETFCIEESVYFYPGTLYNATISNYSDDGKGTKIPITMGTAWLYYNFAKGILQGYDYSNPNRQIDAGVLQKAIWWLQGQASFDSGNYYDNLVVSQFGSQVAAQEAANGSYGVMALDLFGVDSGVAAQDQLILVPEPATLLLLGLGIIGVGVTRKFSR